MIIEGKRSAREIRDAVDVCVVGSGAAGAVVAKELAEAGRTVAVVEEGNNYTVEQYGSWTPSQSLKYMARNYGMISVFGIGDTPLITVSLGKCVGGSSVLTGGVCFRIPEEVLREWQTDHGLTGLGARDLDPCFEHVERLSHVEEVPASMRSKASEKFAQGCTSLGVSWKPLRRNTENCRGCGRCNFGCPHDAKKSVNITYIKKLCDLGGRVYSNCLAKRVLTHGERAAGVEGEVVDAEGKPRGIQFSIEAKIVVVAAGSTHTPRLLLQSGLAGGSSQIGRNLTLHPGFRVLGLFDDPVDAWKGSLQSIYVDHFMKEGITLIGLFVPPGLIASALPGFGANNRRYIEMVRHLGAFGGIIHDDSRGTIRNIPGPEPLITYRLLPRDKTKLLRGIRLLAEIYFAAGARKIFLPIFGVHELSSMDEVRKIDETSVKAKQLECMVFHPLGSCRMGADPRTSVVGPSGETHEVRNLFVADGSIFPTSIGVNSQEPIMALATKIAWGIRDGEGKYFKA